MLVDLAFNYLKIHKLVAKVEEVNVGSCKILEKNKFILEGKLRDHFRIEGKYYSGLLTD